MEPDRPSSSLRSPFATLVGLVIVVWGLREAREFLVPLCLAALLAFLMAPIVRVLERRARLPEWAIVTISALILILPLLGFIYLSATQVQALIENWSSLSASLLRSLVRFRGSPVAERLHLASLLNPQFLRERLQSNAGSEVKLALTSLRKILTAGTLLVLVIFFSVVMLASRGQIRRSVDRLLADYTGISSAGTVDRMGVMMESFLIARMLIAALIGAASFLLTLAFGVPYSFLLGAFLGLMTWVPVVGLFVGIFPILVVGFGSGRSGGAMVGIAVSVVALWVFQDHILTPRWVGHRLKLNFLATYLAIFAGERIWGAWGIFLSVPLLGLLRIVCGASPRLRPWAYAISDDSCEFDRNC